MKIAVVQGHMENYAELAKLTTYGNKAEYCARHGYDLHVKTDNFTMASVHPVTWDRLRFMFNLLKTGKYDWIWTVGTDTLVTNMTVKLETLIDPAFHFVISCEWCSPMQADSFLTRCSPEGSTYIEYILSKFGEFKAHPWVEQAAMLECKDRFKDIIKILPQRAMNSYDYKLYMEMYPDTEKVKEGTDYFGQSGQWQPGDFLIHWPGLKLHHRLQLVEEYTPKIVR
jgi:hypothetical protein